MGEQGHHLIRPRNPSKAIPVEESCTLDFAWLRGGDIPIEFPLWDLINWWAGWSDTPIASAFYRVLMDEVPDPILEIEFVGSALPLPSRLRQTITLTTTPMPKGGVRWWLACPNCHGNRAKLHLPMHGDRFLCRTCHGLTYTSCQEAHRWDPVYDHIARERGISRPAARRRLEGYAKSWALEDTV